MATPTTLPASFVAGNVLQAAQLNDLRGAFRVLQVVSTTKTDTFSMSSSTFANVTGLTATITPSATSSKILVVAYVVVSQQVGTNLGFIRLARGGTGIAIGNAAGSRIRAGAGVEASGAQMPWNAGAISTLDSPATTSATTYSLQVATNGSGSMYVNRSTTDTDSTLYGRYSSTITVMEISA